MAREEHESPVQRPTQPEVAAPGDAVPAAPAGSLRSRYGKWRALSLIGVYVLMIIHITHWKVSGKTMAPLELSEIMKALELGVVSPGVIFIGIMLIGSFIFGRFFCSWGCHMLALQDLSHWILKKLRIRPRPVRSRVLLLAPFGAATYMFLWPQIHRLWEGRALPESSARLVTTDFWRDLPGPIVITLTALTCGFLIIYFFGGRGFCTYGCPYGVLFGFMDRFAPGKIRLRGSCEQCGRCTAICTSNVRVHEEIKAHGMVVSPLCMKDLDCVSVCPQDALKYRFGRPSLARHLDRERPPRPRYDFTWSEDIAMAALFLLALFTWRGLYDRLPFLMSLALSALTAYVVVTFARLFRRPALALNRYTLKVDGALTRAGKVFAASSTVFLLFTAHSAFIQVERARGDAALERARGVVGKDASAVSARRAALEECVDHYLACADRGLFSTSELEYRIGAAMLSLDWPAQAVEHLRRSTELSPLRPDARVQLAEALSRDEQPLAARDEYEYALRLYTPHDEYQEQYRQLYARAHAGLGKLLAGLLGQVQDPQRAEQLYTEGKAHFEEALRLAPDDTAAHLGAGYLAGLRGADGLAEATRHYEAVIRLDPEAAEAHSNLGDVAMAGNDPIRARECYERAAAIDPGVERVQFKLGFIEYTLGHPEEALAHLELAVNQDPRDREAAALRQRLLAERERATTGASPDASGGPGGRP